MNIIVSTVFYCVIEFLIEAIGWGLFGYLFFRFIGMKEKYWYWDWLIVVGIFLLWDYWSNTYLIKLDISIGNQEVLAFIRCQLLCPVRDNYLVRFFSLTFS